MATLQVTRVKLAECGFSPPAGASSYFPQNDPDTHVHLGTPTQHDGKVAQEGSVFVTFVSIKQNDQHLVSLTKSAVTGRFNGNIAPLAWPPGLLGALQCLNVLQ